MNTIRLRQWWTERRRVRAMRAEVETFIENNATLARRRPPTRWHRFRVRLREIVREHICEGPSARPIFDGEGRVIGAVEMPGRER